MFSFVFKTSTKALNVHAGSSVVSFLSMSKLEAILLATFILDCYKIRPFLSLKSIKTPDNIYNIPLLDFIRLLLSLFSAIQYKFSEKKQLYCCVLQIYFRK